MLLVDSITFDQAIRSIREVVLDTNPVQCFKVGGQDLPFVKDSNGIALNGNNFTFIEVEKFYDLMDKLSSVELNIEILPDFAPNEFCVDIVNFNYPALTETKTISRKNYFSQNTIEKVMEEFFYHYCPYDGIPKFVSTIFNSLHYMEKRKLILWVSYYLIDRKRMQYASAGELIRINSLNGSGTSCGSDGELKNTDVTTTTRVGEVFSVTERTTEDGKGLEGFTSLWGDKYSYFTKLQLWIRERFEKQFKDFSLRDNAMINQTFTIEKGWENSSWIDTINFSVYTRDLLLPDNRV